MEVINFIQNQVNWLNANKVISSPYAVQTATQFFRTILLLRSMFVPYTQLQYNENLTNTSRNKRYNIL